MNKQTALNILDNLANIANATRNTTLGAIQAELFDDIDFDNLDALRDAYANLTWDTSLAEARDIIQSEVD